MKQTKKPNDYYIAAEEQISALTDRVTRLMAEGWEVHGSPFIYYEKYDGYCTRKACQAMVRRVREAV